MHCSGDADVACFISGCELTWFLMCTVLVIQTVTCLVLVGELAWFLICTLLVTQMWPVLFQAVSWPCFNVQSSGDTDCPVFFQRVSWSDF